MAFTGVDKRDGDVERDASSARLAVEQTVFGTIFLTLVVLKLNLF